MKTLIALLAVAALSVVGAGSALARSHATAPNTVAVVMHDPGCHVFSVKGKLLTKLTTSGPAVLSNLDEATLNVHIVGLGTSRGDRLDRVGQRIVLERGVYMITMVGQASDDNHLRLTVK